MAKKSFKDQSQKTVASMFMTGVHDTVKDAELYVQDVQNTDTHDLPEICRLNFKIRREYKEYLEYISWNNGTNMTQYLVNLIKEDMAKHEQNRFKRPTFK